jgi:hypothetical protein
VLHLLDEFADDPVTVGIIDLACTHLFMAAATVGEQQRPHVDRSALVNDAVADGDRAVFFFSAVDDPN